jgi:uncharacterized hydrophobic protein (TIGR00271 family)
VLHLRVVVPTDLREPVVEMLRRQVGVANVLLFPGVGVETGDDEICADVARESANEIIHTLKDLEVHHRGTITLQPFDTVLSSQVHRTEEAAEGEPADALVWDELIARTREDSALTATFVTFLTIACLLAAIGVITDSAVTVVGAMVVGPEFGPLAALAVAINQRRSGLARQAAAALLVGFPVAMTVTAAVTWGAKRLGWVTLDNVQAVRQVEFIYQVGPMSFAVALLAGAAGMLSLLSSKSAALVGVFISVTTVPAAGFAVVAAVLGDWPVAARSVIQLAVNLVGIVLAGLVMLSLRPRTVRMFRTLSRRR